MNMKDERVVFICFAIAVLSFTFGVYFFATMRCGGGGGWDTIHDIPGVSRTLEYKKAPDFIVVERKKASVDDGYTFDLWEYIVAEKGTTVPTFTLQAKSPSVAISVIGKYLDTAEKE